MSEQNHLILNNVKESDMAKMQTYYSKTKMQRRGEKQARKKCDFQRKIKILKVKENILQSTRKFITIILT